MDFETFDDIRRWFDHALGAVTNDEINPLRYALSIFRDRSQMGRLLETILRNPLTLQKVAVQSYAHANGFDKIVLISSSSPQYKLRLHIWWPISNISIQTKKWLETHNHRWNFNSLILTGTLWIQHFDVMTLNQAGMDMYEYIYTAPEGKDHYTLEFVGPAKLRCTFDGMMTAGNHYALTHTVQHHATSEREKATATLVLCGSVMKPQTAVFTDRPIEGYERVEIAPLSTTELSQKLKDLYTLLS